MKTNDAAECEQRREGFSVSTVVMPNGSQVCSADAEFLAVVVRLRLEMEEA